MSNRKGSQRHQNGSAYNPSKYGLSRRVKQAAATSLGGLCARCRDKIEWKKKYDKYKPLTVPKKCITCGERTVKQAYYQICHTCAEERSVCAKCGEPETIVESFPMDKSEEARERSEFTAGLKAMKERERRTLLREQAKGSKTTITTDTAPAENECSKNPLT